MINAHWEDLTFTIQEGRPEEWRRIVDTSLASPEDIARDGRRTSDFRSPACGESQVDRGNDTVNSLIALDDGVTIRKHDPLPDP